MNELTLEAVKLMIAKSDMKELNALWDSFINRRRSLYMENFQRGVRVSFKTTDDDHRIKMMHGIFLRLLKSKMAEVRTEDRVIWHVNPILLRLRVP